MKLGTFEICTSTYSILLFLNNRCQYDEMPYELLAVPNFDSERLFITRMGDKKDLVQ